MAENDASGRTDAQELIAGHYFLAVEGLAMLRRVLDDPTSLSVRAAEVAQVVAAMAEFPQSLAIPVVRYDVDAGYTRWAPRYDGPNPAIATEEPVVAELLAELDPPGRTVLDAACGTGRHSATLAAAGWDVVGVDANRSMLDVARAKVPSGDFRRGRLEALPVDDDSVDLVVCSLALTHVADLAPVFAEFARALTPGGQLVTTDMHPAVTALGGGAAFPVDDGGGPPLAIHYVPNLVHQAGEYVAAMVHAGLAVRGCREPEVTEDLAQVFPAFGVLPEATRQAFVGLPYLLVWLAEQPAAARA